MPLVAESHRSAGRVRSCHNIRAAGRSPQQVILAEVAVTFRAHINNMHTQDELRLGNC